MDIIITSNHKKQVIDITDRITDELKKSKQVNSVCFLFIKHTTACITTADLDPGTDEDMLDAFEAMMPKLHYRHPHNPPHVTDHILSSIIGPSLIIPVKHGELALGVWQRVVLIELDGPRERSITFSFINS